MTDMDSIADRTGIDGEVVIAVAISKLLNMKERGEKVGMGELPPALAPKTVGWGTSFGRRDVKGDAGLGGG